MTVAVIALAAALAAGIAAIAWLARKLESALYGQVEAQRLFVDEKRVAEEYLAQRDAKEVRISELTSLNNALKQRNTMLEIERNKAFQDAKEQVVERLRRSNVADAAVVLEQLLAEPLLPGLPDSDQASPYREGSPRETGMSPSRSAGADSVERQDPG